MVTKKTGPRIILNHIEDSSTKTQSGIQPILTAGSAASRKSTAKKQRTRHPNTKPRHDAHVASAKEATAAQDMTPTVPGSSQNQSSSNEPTKIYLRSFTFEDEAMITKFTQDEIAPIFKETYGIDLDMMTVLNYVRSAQTRMILVEDQVAGYVSSVLDDSGKMNIGALVLASPYQGKGYGTRIMRQIEQEARAYGAVEMEVFIQATNKRSQAFAKSLGFVEGPQLQPQTIVMIKPLQPIVTQPVE
ncbi:GNAT family N-acetyltransferase [Sulfoacidibacillus thermotolerans]|uniref:N-acetyltransferase domain-containing protein n=1 Tax=Sulfoacidibacillus thermotolerans TaxID=1765684 RepID=A0A2U3D2W0_SULT2|nr:GNAT family N-acetyltransferase [Sulfoacidibacillus thermotolerans]PWI55630.1 hypothetical protein BM613_13345 [Sulfoacidibacillus thermotolerans]